jgi:hypothetical protein
MKRDELQLKESATPFLVKNEAPEDANKPDDRKAYSQPQLKRLGKLSEIAKRGILTGNELIVLLRS